MKQYDVAIIGAGPVGLSFAIMAAKQGLTVAIMDRHDTASLTDPRDDGREIALTHKSKRLLTETGLWPVFPVDEIGLIKQAKVLNGHWRRPLFFDSQVFRKDCLGFILPHHVIRRAAYHVARQTSQIDFFTGVQVDDMETGPDGVFIDIDAKSRIKAIVLVAADSRFSATRRARGIAASLHDFGRVCLVCRMHIEKPHDQVAYEHFFYDRTLAVLPLAGPYVSVVLTVPSDKADAIREQTNKDFSQDIMNYIQHRYGCMTRQGGLFAYPLVGTWANSFYAERCALIGDAAVGMHPVTAQGFNLGLQSASILVQEMAKAKRRGGDIGSTAVLKRYQNRYRPHAWPLYWGTNALVKLYTRTSPLTRLARHAVLFLGEKTFTKRMIVNRLTS